jgi:hypothetical protein
MIYYDDGDTAQWVSATAGIVGAQGIQGIQGRQGVQGVQGIQGIQGTTGLAFTIAKTYLSVAALTADTSPTSIIAGQFALINTADVEDADNSKLYLWNGATYIFQNDLSGTAGIQGVTGSQGTQGIQGIQGIEGMQGTQGAQGLRGSQGAQGIQGIQGTDGTQGTQGAQGLQGTQGLQGEQGIQGIQGVQGIQGAQGRQGTQGTQGIQGLQGIQGIQGAQGTQGAQGIQGTTGLAFTIAKTYLSVAALVADTAPTGIISGQFALINTTNVEDADNSKLYIWNGSSYIFVDDLSGSAGIQGITGTQGTQGTQGIQGIQGAQGTQGIQGLQGVQGTQGALGVQGTQGTQGTQGVQGIQGPQGTQGIQGVQGIQGAQGTQGQQGIQGTQGTQGIQGIQGSQGTQGQQGIQGIQGTQGTLGTQGTQGIQGLQGIQGRQGVQGITGSQGTVGANGAQGITGSTGSTGIQGITGIQGALGTQGSVGAGSTRASLGLATTDTVTFRDVYCSRGDGTGVVYLNASGGKYLYFDGTNYQMPGGALTVGGNIGASNFSGSHSGTSSGTNTGDQTNISGSASSATFLNSSNYINRVGSSGNANTDFNNTPAGTVRHNGDDANLANSPGNTWWFYDNYRHSNGSNYWGTQIAWGWEDNANRLAQRNVTGGSWSGWVYYLNSGNYNSYAPTLTGGNASGTWGINVTGTANNITAYTINQSVGSGNNVDFNRVRPRAAGISLGSGNSSQLEINNAGSGACNISFHREGAYGAHFGLDTDNWFSTYGWSAGGGYTSMRVGSLTSYGDLYATGNVTAYSDVKLKENIVTIDSALDKVKELRGVYYNKKSDESKTRKIGVIAQEIQKILPEVVLTSTGKDEESTLSVDYGNITALLIEAIKDQQKQIEELKLLVQSISRK